MSHTKVFFFICFLFASYAFLMIDKKHAQEKINITKEIEKRDSTIIALTEQLDTLCVSYYFVNKKDKKLIKLTRK